MNNSIAIHAKSIDFLLENAGPVIQYRLRKEARLLEQIYQLPPFVLLQSYVKPDGYIGSGMHSWDNWRGQVLHETPLQDGGERRQAAVLLQDSQGASHGGRVRGRRPMGTCGWRRITGRRTRCSVISLSGRWSFCGWRKGHDIIKTPFSELCTHGKRPYKYTLQAVGIHFIFKYINRKFSWRIRYASDYY